MQLGIVGLGRMGLNIARRLLSKGHQVVGYDQKPEPLALIRDAGGTSVASLAELRSKLGPPASVWIMLPPGEPTESTITELAENLHSGEILIDGGNGHFKDDIRRARELGAHGIFYLDVGTLGRRAAFLASSGAFV